MKKHFPIIVSIFFLTTCEINFSNDFDSKMETLVGQGNIISKIHNLNDFNSIKFSGSGDVTLIKDIKSSLNIEEFENLVDFWTVSIENKTLIIKRKENIFFQNSKAKMLIKTNKNIENISLYGSPNVKINSGVENISKIELFGSSKLELIEKLSTKFCEINLYGSGECNLSNLIASKVKTDVNGSRDL
ncbi:MAG TPA: DUF2807 domain-containing protein, partial [Saprospiraceae bacterium]|nr:DUF2807 domain-containing protein [Saprospiraceae bacterium]